MLQLTGFRGGTSGGGLRGWGAEKEQREDDLKDGTAGVCRLYSCLLGLALLFPRCPGHPWERQVSNTGPLGIIILPCASNWSPVHLEGFIPVLCERVCMALYPVKALARSSFHPYQEVWAYGQCLQAQKFSQTHMLSESATSSEFPVHSRNIIRFTSTQKTMCAFSLDHRMVQGLPTSDP